MLLHVASIKSNAASIKIYIQILCPIKFWFDYWSEMILFCGLANLVSSEF